MITHEIAVGEKALDPKTVDVGTKGSYGIYELHFTFSEEWDDLIKKVSFYPAGRGAPVVVILTGDDDTVSVPQEVTASAGICLYIVSGTASGVSLITLVGNLTIADTKVPATTPAGSPTASEIEQIYAYMQNAVSDVNKLPVPGASGNWLIWDFETEAYTDSGYPTRGLSGPAGATGATGSTGAAGASAYVHIRWGTSSTPGTLLTAPADYIGICSSSSSTAPSTYSGYSWFKYKGDVGATGASGATGQTGSAGTSAYVHIRWGTTATPSSLLTTPDTYIGICSSDSSTAPSTYSGYSWFKYKGEVGATGETGPAGEAGPQGVPGNTLYATFSVSTVDGFLYVTYPDNYAGPTYTITDGILEVTV